MKMGTGSHTGTTDLPDLLPDLDLLPGLYVGCAQVRVKALITIAVVDKHMNAVPMVILVRQNHGAIRDGVDR